MNVARFERNYKEFDVFFFFFSVHSRILLNIYRFHSKARALSCVLPNFGPLWGWSGRPPPLKPPLSPIFIYHYISWFRIFRKSTVADLTHFSRKMRTLLTPFFLGFLLNWMAKFQFFGAKNFCNGVRTERKSFFTLLSSLGITKFLDNALSWMRSPYVTM